MFNKFWKKVILGLVGIGFCTIPVQAGTVGIQSFITPPYVSVLLSNSTSYLGSQTGFTAYIGVRNYNSIPYASGTTFVTNMLINPYVFLQNGGGYTNASGGTNGYFVSQTTGVTNTAGSYNPAAFTDTTVTSDGVGNVSTSQVIQATLTGAASNATNSVTFGFARSFNGGKYYDTNTIFSFAVSLNGTNTVTVATNLPSWFVTGAPKVVLYNITHSNTNSSTYLNSLDLCGVTQ